MIAAEMRMSVYIGRRTVRRPAGVSDSAAPESRLFAELRRKRVDAASGFGDRQSVAGLRRNARAVVASVFEPPQTGDDKPASVAGTDVADDSTHAVDSTSGVPGHASQGCSISDLYYVAPRCNWRRLRNSSSASDAADRTS